jgi:hypothetical protein
MQLLTEPSPTPAVALLGVLPAVAPEPRAEWHAEYEEIE